MEIEGIRQEHQLKMTYLQQELQQNAREQDRIRQAELRGGELINQADLDRAKIRDSERYLRGTWKEAHFGNEQPPYVIFCTNPLQDLNPLKEEAFRIAPFQRTYDNFKARNAAYVGRLFSTITISETFKSEAEARSFFYRELNCPCIIVYGIFTGTGFGIYALTAGMSPDQLRIDGQKVADWGLRIEKLWDISYNTIQAIKQKALDDAIKQIKKKAAETGNALPTDPELLRQKAVELRGRFDVLEGLELYTDTHVGLCVQVILDNYFSYYPRQVYEVKTPDFLEAKQKELTRLGIWEALKTSLLERYEVLKGRQENLISNKQSGTNSQNFIAIDFNSLVVDKNGDVCCKDLNGNELSPYVIRWDTDNINSSKYVNRHGFQILPYSPYFNSGFLRIQKNQGLVGFLNQNGEFVIPTEYEDSDDIRENFISVKKNDKWGLIDITGKIVLPFEYDKLSSPLDSFCVFEKKDESGIVDIDGNITFIYDKQEYEHYQLTHDGYIITWQRNDNGGAKHGALDFRGELVLPAKFSQLMYIGNNSFIFQEITSKNGFTITFGLYNNQTKKYTQLDFETSVKKKNYYNRYDLEIVPYLVKYFDSEYQIVTLKKYDDSGPMFFFILDTRGNIKLLNNSWMINIWDRNKLAVISENKIVFIVQHSNSKDKNDKFRYGFFEIAKDGEPIIKIPSIYENAMPFFEGLAAVKKGNKWGYINEYNEKIIPFEYEHADSFIGGMAVVSKNRKQGVINKKNHIVIPFTFKWIKHFEGNCMLAQVEGSSSNLYVVINKEGKILVM
ncbi:WG repeat-containing protein [Runella sp.]|uniref:WG repeat-containing protein n=1 Tax=Runella sp. TaxID=1960881 RepID=UPI00260A1972|nr:WG repeat-containing protein [Runella sp.]